MRNNVVLIVDDEPDLCELLEITLGRMQLNTHVAHNIATAKQQLATQAFALCLTDMRLPDGNGLELVELIQQQYSGMPVVVITAYGNMEAAIRALKARAFDFISKPVDLKSLRQIVAAALAVTEQSSVDSADPDQPQLLGESPAIIELKKTISKLGRSQAPVHIHGESGTGKELVAKLIHAQSPRHNKAFVPVNCGAIPAELMESEFFGHQKGSFSGAHTDKPGLFAAADGGTLFLDEVAELPLNMQVKLLRAIQERAIRPVGAANETPVDVRILSASHKNLAQLVADGSFRQDLFYRINVIQVDVPNLNTRGNDILLLAQHILQKIAAKQQYPQKTLSADASKRLLQYGFPGNVRELENILERTVALSEHPVINADDLQLPNELPATVAQTEHVVAAPVADNIAIATDLEQTLLNQERESIKQALETTRWNKTKAAQLLGISFRQLRYRIKKLGIE